MEIQINLLRISPDSKYIEFSVECPTGYRFTVLKIKKYDYLTTPGYPTNSSGFVNLSNAYVGTSTKEIIRVSTDIFKGSTLFYVEFGVAWTSSASQMLDELGNPILDELGNPIYEEVGGNNTPEPVDPCTGKLSDNNVVAVCSDTNSFYEYLLAEVLKLNSSCPQLTPDVKRAHIFLNAHIEAMRLKRYLEAERLYDVLKTNFCTCSLDERYVPAVNCNCNG